MNSPSSIIYRIIYEKNAFCQTKRKAKLEANFAFSCKRWGRGSTPAPTGKPYF
jgi:hypothetical protein